jgi:hypothetical protein
MEITKQELGQIIESSMMKVVDALLPKATEISIKEAESRWGEKWIRYHLKVGSLPTRRLGMAKNSKVVVSTSDILQLKLQETCKAYQEQFN